jgi:hypothetical protein
VRIRLPGYIDRAKFIVDETLIGFPPLQQPEPEITHWTEPHIVSVLIPAWW